LLSLVKVDPVFQVDKLGADVTKLSLPRNAVRFAIPVPFIKQQPAPRPCCSTDPTRCIRCGLCAARCLTEAVKMETFRFTEEVQFVEAA
jgi:ferredoxin